MRDKIPNLFLVGAPKCGTSALAEYLSGHPNVLFSAPKEPHYFAFDFPRHRAVPDRESYLNLFGRAGPEHTVRGEGSVWYLHSREAVPRIRAFNPAAKLVVMLRNPADLVYSLHSTHLRATDEDVADFGQAWALQADRAEGRHIPRNCRTPALLQYREVACLGEQVGRLLENCPREQVHFILFDDFRKRTAEIYRDTLAFIGLPDDGRTDFPVVNANQVRHSRWLAEQLINPPGWLRGAWHKSKRYLGNAEQYGHRFLRWAYLANAKEKQRPPMPPDLREHIMQSLASDIRKLGELIGRDLSHWK